MSVSEDHIRCQRSNLGRLHYLLLPDFKHLEARDHIYLSLYLSQSIRPSTYIV